MTTARPAHSRPRRRARRGAAYVLVLSLGLVISVIGMGVLLTTRVAVRDATRTGEVDEAAVLAQSAAEWGMAAIANDTNWRTTYTSGTATAERPLGRGYVSFKLVDETDGNLSNGTNDNVRVYGIGRVGSAKRIYSVSLMPSGPGLDVLRTAAHSGGAAATSGTVTAAGGPFSSNGSFTVPTGATVTGDVEAASVSLSGTLTGTSKVMAAKTMPGATVFDQYKSIATTIAFSSLSSGNLQNAVLSPLTNPYGLLPNAKGVYYVRVPANGTLTIRQCRLVATLVVEVDAGGKVATSGSFLWDPPQADYPALIVKATTGCSVDFGGSTTSLSEATYATNFNPVGTPYPYTASGSADVDTSDSYPSELHGVVHVMGTGFTTTLGSNLKTKGCVIVEGSVTYGGGISLTSDPTLLTTPPQGYRDATVLAPLTGTWRWEASP
ncbi:MAG TPA: hypothetical protein VF796_04740 [Humisphaera sp.]